MNFTRNIMVLFVALFALNTTANEYKNSYYEDEGDLLFKIRGFYLNTNAKLTKLPASLANKEKPKSFAQNGYGFDTATTYFFTDNIAAELSLGFGIIKVKSAALASASNAFGNGGGSSGKRNEIYYIPATATAQYHLAPFGALRPYIGGGYNGTFMHTRSKAIKTANGHGPVVQVGIDFVSKDDTIFTFDVRQYFLKSKVTFKKGFLNSASDVGSTVVWNPLVISAGFGFKF
ncbi:MAG: OmpW family protein [Rickettsiaceae bacterium]|nr:OmpW family protein [Rickettsiaceae bacterium]